MKNIHHLSAEGKRTVAGLLLPNEKVYRRIFILNPHSLAETPLWVNTDPVVEPRLMEAEL